MIKLTIYTNKRTLWLTLLLVLGIILLFLGFYQRRPSTLSSEQTSKKKASQVTEINEGVKAPSGDLGVIPQVLLEEKTGDTFFVGYRFERDRNRSHQVQLLQDLINNANTSAGTKHDAEKKLLDITGQMEQEMKLESLLVAKGYPAAAAFIQPATVTVIFDDPLLANEDVANIADLVSRTTSHQLKDICIIPRK